jgi:hypothetical protein
MATEARVIDPRMIERLDPVEKIIAHAFVSEGRWILADEEIISDD